LFLRYADEQTDRHTNTLIAILHQPTGVKQKFYQIRQIKSSLLADRFFTALFKLLNTLYRLLAVKVGEKVGVRVLMFAQPNYYGRQYLSCSLRR